MKRSVLNLFPFWFYLITACGSQPIATRAPEATAITTAEIVAATTTTLPPQSDPCSPEYLPDAVQGLNDLMREFDDASRIVSKTPMEQLPGVISNLQRIRRAAEDIPIPLCLTTLKTHQLNHMNMMIQTLILIVSSADQKALIEGLENARKERDLYSLEFTRLLGVTPPQPSSQGIPAITSTP